jgi:hypothetical protein
LVRAAELHIDTLAELLRDEAVATKAAFRRRPWSDALQCNRPLAIAACSPFSGLALHIRRRQDAFGWEIPQPGPGWQSIAADDLGCNIL